MAKFKEAPEPVNYNAFKDDERQISKQGVKLDNSNSMFSGKTFKSTQFDESVSDDFIKKDADFRQKALTFATAYKKAIQDKTLPDNKGTIGKDEEKSLIKDLINLATDINNDQTQPEGVGSSGLNSLLLQVCLYQRDQINELLYRVQKLEKNSK